MTRSVRLRDPELVSFFEQIEEVGISKAQVVTDALYWFIENELESYFEEIQEALQ